MIRLRYKTKKLDICLTLILLSIAVCSLIPPLSEAQTVAEIALDLQVISARAAAPPPLILSLNQNRAVHDQILKTLPAGKYTQQLILSETGKTDALIITSIQTPIIEYRQNNPTKYRLRVHGAREDFPLILQQTFHADWKAYLMPAWPAAEITSRQIDHYGTLDGDAHDQASPIDIKDYISRGLISTLGDERPKLRQFWGNPPETYYSAFISKIHNRRIQNNNLPNGAFHETWMRQPLQEERHWLANGFANCWWIDVESIKKNGRCTRNPDGSINFEVVLEFQAQKIFYLGYIISGLTLLGCTSMLLFSSIRRRTACRHKPDTHHDNVL